jgi:hypothetical protein
VVRKKNVADVWSIELQEESLGQPQVYILCLMMVSKPSRSTACLALLADWPSVYGPAGTRQKESQSASKQKEEIASAASLRPMRERRFHGRELLPAKEWHPVESAVP